MYGSDRRRLTQAAAAWLVATILALGILGESSPQTWAACDDEEPDQNAQRQPGFTEENFDMWVFGNNRTAYAGRKNIETRLSFHVEEVDRICHLNDSQREKLMLAARGDIKRFFDRVEQARKKFRAVRHDQQRFQEIWQEIQPLQLEMNAGLFGEKSLFHNALRKTLTGEQAEAFQQVERERRNYLYESTRSALVMSFDNFAPLREEQRTALLELMQKHTTPPERFGPYDQQLLLYQLGQVPEENIRPIFDEIQWRTFSKQLVNARGMKQFLIENGSLPTTQKDDKPKPVAKARAANVGATKQDE